MLSTIEIVESVARPAAVIPFSIPRDAIQEVMGAAIAEVIEVALRQGIGPAGPVFSHHFRMEPDRFHFEVGVPVSGPVTPEGRVLAGELPGAARVLRTVYTGPYDGLGEAWGQFTGQIEADGHSTAPNLWECYLTNPEECPDPAAYETELNRPLL